MLEARRLTGRMISLKQDQSSSITKIAGWCRSSCRDLKPAELEKYHQEKPANPDAPARLSALLSQWPARRPCHRIRRTRGTNAGWSIENNELLWPNAEGREGLGADIRCTAPGEDGPVQHRLRCDGQKGDGQISIPPQPGYNVITTLDENIQRLAEQSLEKGAKRGAIVVMDPNNGDILALASWPTINPNDFIPNISPEAFQALQDDKDIPLLPRAFRSAYPPGSTFKCSWGSRTSVAQGRALRRVQLPARVQRGQSDLPELEEDAWGLAELCRCAHAVVQHLVLSGRPSIGAQPIIDYSTSSASGQKRAFR